MILGDPIETSKSQRFAQEGRTLPGEEDKITRSMKNTNTSTNTSTNTHTNTLIENDVLTMLVRGVGLSGPRFEQNLRPEGTLLVFLRHFGCTFCRETVHKLRQAQAHASASGPYPHVLFVAQGSEATTKKFFQDHWPEASAISDSEHRLYQAFEIRRGSFPQLFSPAVLLCGLRGLAKGHGIGLPKSDPFIMPGAFFIRGAEIVWSHEYRHAGDHPDFHRIPEFLHLPVGK